MKLERKEQILQGPVGFQIWDMDQDFKQAIIWLPRGEWMGGGRGLLLKLQHQCLGHTGYAAAQGQ